MANYSQFPIESFEQSWERGEDGLHHSGKQVREFLGREVGKKFGAIYFDQSSQTIYFFANEDAKEEWQATGNMDLVLGSDLVSMTSKVIELKTNLTSSTINMSVTATSVPLTVEFESRKKEYDEPEWTIVTEDIYLTVQVAHGAYGKYETVVDQTVVPNGQTFETDLRKYLSVGENRVLISARGLSSGVTSAVRYVFNLTTMYLKADAFSWHKAWKEGETILLDNLYYYAAAAKTLYVQVDDNAPISFEKGIAVNYETAPDALDITSLASGLTTGVHNLKVWMEAMDLTSDVFNFQVMYIRTVDLANTSLVVINDVAKEAVNFDTTKLFSYATYGATSATFSVYAEDAKKRYDIISGQQQTVVAEEKTPYSIRIEVEQDETIPLNLYATINVNGQTSSVEIKVDNSKSYGATAGATFYLNPSTRSNGTSDREKIINASIVSGVVPQYDATWTNFAWTKDGWSADENNQRCLVVQAGSTVDVPQFKPLQNASTQSLTFECKVKSSTVADYNSPILSVMSSDTYDESLTSGIIIFPTQILVLSSTDRGFIAQSVNLLEEDEIHLAVVLQRNYNNLGYNLAHIYVNGVRNAVFTFSGTANFGSGYLKLGQSKTDLYLYSMRVYPFVLEAAAIKNNYLNTASGNRAQIQSANDIVDGGAISYDLVKQKGYNTIIWECDQLPDLDHTQAVTANWHIEYGDHPEWNVDILGVPTDGQGTTSSKYKKWNLRGKTASSTRWHYPNNPNMPDSVGKNGYIFGEGSLAVNKITWKKNVASSQQGHKMGGCNFYDALYSRLGLKDACCPNSSVRVAVEQYPFFGFQRYSNGDIVFVGLYTGGADKGNKKTFGYSEKYPNCLSLEGPNHNPLGTRFLYPWQEVAYSTPDETLTFGGEEGWDADYAGSHYDTASGTFVENESDGAADNANILALYESEWKPAYKFVYDNSLYLKSLSEIGYASISALNDNISTFRSGNIGGISNQVWQVYDSNYDVYFYSNASKRYIKYEGYNLKTDLASYLGGVASPSADQLRDARGRRFVENLGSYWNEDSMLFHECFLMLTGTSDNHAKNEYPFKFKTFAEGGRWSFRQDDVDTSLATDNNGNSTKSYSIESGDKTSNGISVFQGDDSALWYNVRNLMQDKLKAMMGRVIAAIQGIAADKGVSGATLHETIYKVFSYYYWDKSANYFPCIAYNEDSRWAYIDVWASNPTATYNGVAPLTQALGDQLKAEQQWVERRIAYILSKYNLGGFTGSASDGYGSMEFTPANNFTFNLKPAIDLYPSGNSGGGVNVNGGRTKAGATAQIEATSDGATTFYIKGLDWLSDIGDLSRLRLTTRGADDSSPITFSVQSKRLQNLKVGDASTSNVSASGFNAATLLVSGDALETIDARNVSSMQGEQNLLGCPRLRKAYFSGTSLASVLLPISSKVNEVSYPASLTTFFMHSLPLLKEQGITLPSNVKGQLSGIYINNCDGVDGLGMLADIIGTDGHALRYIFLVWEGTKEVSSSTLDMLYKALNDGYGRLVFNADNGQLSQSNEQPFIQGKVHIGALSTVYKEWFEEHAPNLTINYDNLTTPSVVEIGLAMEGGDITINENELELPIHNSVTASQDIFKNVNWSANNGATISSNGDMTPPSTYPKADNVTATDSFVVTATSKYNSAATARRTISVKRVGMTSIALNIREGEEPTKVNDFVKVGVTIDSASTKPLSHIGFRINDSNLATIRDNGDGTALVTIISQESGDVIVTAYNKFADSINDELVWTVNDIIVVDAHRTDSAEMATNDAEIMRLLYEDGTATNPNALTKSEAENITSMRLTGRADSFAQSNTIITNLEFLEYTKVSDLNYGCNDMPNLKIARVPKTCVDSLNHAFYNDPSLKYIYLHDRMTAVSDTMTRSCSASPKVYLPCTTPPKFGNTLGFDGKTVYYVPDESLSLYASASQWSTRYDAGRVKPISEFS